MTERDDGGPAFVILQQGDPDQELPAYCWPGMSYRRWLGGMALMGIRAAGGLAPADELGKGIRGGKWDARAAWALADAMLREE